MTTTSRAPLWISLAGLCLLLMGLGGFVFNGAGRWAIAGAPVVLLSWLALMPCLERLRPKSSLDAWVGFMAIFIPLFLYMGGHSLWLTVLGERLDACEVTAVSTHANRRSPDTVTNDVTCGDRKLVYTPSWGVEAKEKGERVDLVVDRIGFTLDLEPAKVSTGRNLLVPLAVAWGVGSVLLVLRAPRREPKKKRQATLRKDFM
ncbi:hypothetical protein [Lentzea flaviverrucosa]|uniref:Uncharacterized protein n=1 Tax=Lentzea flaviverrucosa TaxID=200379 RepID=A0A1H9RQ05_9PSEU|nr:hypothetical protein [Lentzea flaviverrucosa]RDI33072.1 hypothetical protein DFR72_102320 [Lentzea flaviverrucosa]SER73969.1 hypothetical protein SAMN05216195_106321 [Lentzea flaviverrucosa]